MNLYFKEKCKSFCWIFPVKTWLYLILPVKIQNSTQLSGLFLSKSKYRPVRKKYDSFKLKIFINKKFWKPFYFFTCIWPDYVAHDITKEFWKNSNFENMTAGFLLRCQNWLRYEISLIWHWNINLLKQNWSFVYVKVPNDDQNVI